MKVHAPLVLRGDSWEDMWTDRRRDSQQLEAAPLCNAPGPTHGLCPHSHTHA